jgi:hypothetical protein
MIAHEFDPVGQLRPGRTGTVSIPDCRLGKVSRIPAAQVHFRGCSVSGLRSRTPGPPLLSSMKSTPGVLEPANSS